MIKINKYLLAILCLGLFTTYSHAQLFIDNATVFVQTGGVITVQGDVTSNVDIQGPGKVLLKGTTLQNVNMNGFTIPNLEMDNTANATLLGNARLGSSMLFTNGKVILGNFNARLSDVATVTGGGASKFFETNGTGQLTKEITANLTNYTMPVGSGSAYYPAAITTVGTYASAVVGVQNKVGADPNKHPRSSDYLNHYWPITQTGITGTLNASGNYNANFTGTETDLRGIFWNGTNWNLTGGSINYATDDAAAPIVGNGDLYAMNKFVLAKMKAMLQGAYNGIDMNDNLRAGTNLIPLSDPYRSAPYSSTYTHVNNPTVEIANASVFATAALTGDNIVDWVYLELRDNSGVNPGAAVVQSRAALIQRDGDIVDIDGISPIYFKNVDPAVNYTLAVRHRNHLGIATDPVANLQSLSEATPGAITDYTTMTDAQIFGTSAAFTVGAGSRNLLWGGNANSNANSRFNGLSNDKDYLLVTTLGNNIAAVISNTYSPSDMNMNRTVRFNGINNDKDFLLVSVLGNTIAAIRTQALPQ
jgi:hypothetical protein